MARAVSARLVFLADDYAGYEVRGLLGQHGLSVYIEVVDSDGVVHRVLFDTGQYADGVIHNARLLGVELNGVKAVALSHNHYDHTGGLLGVLKAIGHRVPVIAHPDVFKPSIYIRGNNIRLNIGIPYTRRELEEAGADFILVRSPMEVAPGVYFLGEIDRVHPELAPVLKGNYTLSSDGELVQHELRDDTGVAIAIEGLGTVAIGGCSHSGIVNIAEQAARVTGMNVFAVMGGFHLVSASRETISRVVEELKKMGVEEVHTGHCTGLVAEYAFLEAFGDRFRKIHSGYTVEFKKR